MNNVKTLRVIVAVLCFAMIACASISIGFIRRAQKQLDILSAKLELFGEIVGDEAVYILESGQAFETGVNGDLAEWDYIDSYGFTLISDDKEAKTARVKMDFSVNQKMSDSDIRLSCTRWIGPGIFNSQFDGISASALDGGGYSCTFSLDYSGEASASYTVVIRAVSKDTQKFITLNGVPIFIELDTLLVGGVQNEK